MTVMQRTGTILVFDNNRSIVELITAILSDGGYAVRTTIDGLVAHIGRAGNPPALIVIDFALSARTVAVVRAYARSYDRSAVPVVISSTSPSIAMDGAGGDEYLLKPFSMICLRASPAISSFLTARQPFLNSLTPNISQFHCACASKRASVRGHVHVK